MIDQNPLIDALDKAIAATGVYSGPAELIGVEEKEMTDYADEMVMGWLTSGGVAREGMSPEQLKTLVVAATMAGIEYERSRGKKEGLHWKFER